MPSTRKQREEAVALLSKTLEDIQGLVVTEYTGLKTPELNELRDKLRPLKSECRVVKNTLAQIALKSRGLEPLAEFFDGMSALLIQKGDAVASLKVLMDFTKDHQNLKVRAGYMGGQVFKPAELKALAALPPRQVLLAQLLGQMRSPVQKLHGVLSANLKNLAYALSQVAQKKDGAQKANS